MGKKHVEIYARPLAVGQLMWLTGSCNQMNSTKRQELHIFEPLLIFLDCTFLCFIFLMHFCSFTVLEISNCPLAPHGLNLLGTS